MRKVSILTFILFLVGFMLNSCNTASNEKDCAKPLNPNGDSELALLMRDMAKHLETESVRLKNGEIQGDYPFSFEKIRNAKPSDPKSISGNFDEFAMMYLAALKDYHKSNAGRSAITTYNNLVKSCVNCHQNECPGPIKKIEKNYIN